MRLLTLAAETFDAAQEAREVLVGEGKVYVDRFGQPKPRPEVSIQRDSAISFVGWVLRELDLDVAVLQDRNSPPALVSNRHRYSNQKTRIQARQAGFNQPRHRTSGNPAKAKS